MVGIYKITNVVNGKVYIGQSTDIKKRKAQHFRDLRNKKHCNRYLQNEWNKYGEKSFEFSVLYKCISYELNFYEREYIKKYRSDDSQYGFNLAPAPGVDLSQPHDFIYRNSKVSYAYYDSHDNGFFLDENKEKKYNHLCENCQRDCKQSYRVDLINCPQMLEI